MSLSRPYHIEILSNRLNAIKSKNSQYSLRAFANAINIDAGSLSKILNGQRRLPFSGLTNALNFLELDEVEEKKFINSVSLSHQSSLLTIKNEPIKPIILDEKMYGEIIGNWEYFAILNLIELDNFIPTYEHISERLGLEIDKVESIVKKLIEVDLLRKDPHNRWKRTYRSLTTSDGVSSRYLKMSHSQELKLANKALFDLDINETGFYSITVQTNEDTLQKIKKQAFDFLKKIMKDLEKGPKKEVYQVGLQFFPLTKKRKL